MPFKSSAKVPPAAMIFASGFQLLLLLRGQDGLKLLASARAQRSNFSPFFFS